MANAETAGEAAPRRVGRPPLVDNRRGSILETAALLFGQIRLSGKRQLFLVFPRLFPVYPNDSVLARIGWRLKRLWAGRKTTGTAGTAKTPQ